MALSFDATKPSTFNLFGLNNAQLKRRGLTPTEIQELRRVQREAPAARSVEEVKAAAVSQAESDPEPAPSTRRTTRNEPVTTGMASGAHPATTD